MSDNEKTLDLFRRWGYLQARLDPLGRRTFQPLAELDIKGDAADLGRRIYCGSIGAEFMHIPFADRRTWVSTAMETEPTSPDTDTILQDLIKAEVFEQVLQRYYPGTKRFSLEGVAAMIPLLGQIVTDAADHGVQEVVIGMSHRGKLNVITNIVGKSPVDVFAEFEDVDPRSVLGGGDVKYHIGASGIVTTRNGKQMQVRVVSSPSHLEAVDPVTLGRVRAKQTRAGKAGTSKILAILIHGDAAFAGQGIAAETLNLADLDGYSVGGTIHLIVNNLIGFTANPLELYSSQFASDVAKRLPIPIFHVNGEDPDAVVRTGRMALGYRAVFSGDAVIDLIGFRRHGHSEIDDPTMTQPLLYAKIKDHPPLWTLYAEKTGRSADALVKATRGAFEQAKEKAGTVKTLPRLSVLPDYWSSFTGGRYDPADEVDTGVSPDTLREIADQVNRVPAGFSVHPKVERLMQRRTEMIGGTHPVDFGMAETLAFGTLLHQGIPVRLSGQDSRRGTFGQRHAVLIDVNTEEEYIPLAHIDSAVTRFEIYNSELSEAAVLGFEHGFSRDYPEALVLWEAQFGDFANGAQVIIDQFIAAGEDKWALLSGVVLLLPHGYEGQGPEHSSARIERYLHLAAEDNIQVCQPSSAAQYFHVLRRQALRRWRKPLIVFTPKGLLRLPDAGSALGEFSRPRFLRVLPETDLEEPERLIICSGKIGRDLRRERARRGDQSTAIIFLEQLYPFPEHELTSEIRRYGKLREILWVQEEPANMGAFSFVMPRLQAMAGNLPLRSVKRSESASPATGSAKAHELEQRALLSLAFST